MKRLILVVMVLMVVMLSGCKNKQEPVRLYDVEIYESSTYVLNADACSIDASSVINTDGDRYTTTIFCTSYTEYEGLEVFNFSDFPSVCLEDEEVNKCNDNEIRARLIKLAE